MEDKVLEMIAQLIKREGEKFTDDPADRGGKTKFGITEATARRLGYAGPMENMTMAVATKLYIDEYWVRPRFIRVATLSWPVAMELFDTGVNMGIPTGVVILQRCLNAFNNGSWGDVAIDGAIGTMTLESLRVYLTRRGPEGEKVLVRAMNCLQGERYIDIAERDKTQEKFVYGWMLNRVS